MKKAKILFIGLIFTAILNNLSAQSYETGIGLRASYSWGVTVKHFVTSDAAIEALLTARFNGFNVTGLYEMHYPVFDTEDFYFFFGGGFHAGLWNTDEKDRLFDTRLFAGIDGIIGLEYAFEDIPLSLGVDWKPGFNIISDFGFFYDEIAVSIRYTID